MTTFSPRRGLIDDAFGIGFAAARRIDAFAINPACTVMTSPGCATCAAAEMVLNGLAAEPSRPSLAVAETWNLGGKGERREESRER